MASHSANLIAAIASSTAQLLGPRVMRLVAQFNRFVTNPVQRLWAPHLRHMAVIEHRGRRSGKIYRTPVMAFVVGGKLSVVLNYGERSDWVRNVLAAGSAHATNAGRRYRLDNPRIMSNDSAELPEEVQALGGGQHRVLHADLQPA